ncbi:hypothetical protein B0H50_1612 [Hallerella porci]|uniref:Uncharacterized protein n=1 Tax=Hallerella porci TaxID=1945871 RepID=A0ABX5LH44_9BACT|nr:hypothetical protein B0H50_1612 [Hallerella porci]
MKIFYRLSGFPDLRLVHTHNLLDKEHNRYISPSYWAPQRYGYNIVKLYPNQNAQKETVKFRGIMQQKSIDGYTCFGDNHDFYNGKQYNWCNFSPDKIEDPASAWAFALVAEGADGTPRYSELKIDTAGSFQLM